MEDLDSVGSVLSLDDLKHMIMTFNVRGYFKAPFLRYGL